MTQHPAIAQPTHPARKGRVGGTRRKPPAPAATTLPYQAPPSKLEQLEALLARPDGASIADMVAITGWQAHSVRGALAGVLRRRGHVVQSEKSDGVRRYRIGIA